MSHGNQLTEESAVLAWLQSSCRAGEGGKLALARLDRLSCRRVKVEAGGEPDTTWQVRSRLLPHG